jgi:hypothetical protein
MTIDSQNIQIMSNDSRKLFDQTNRTASYPIASISACELVRKNASLVKFTVNTARIANAPKTFEIEAATITEACNLFFMAHWLAEIVAQINMLIKLKTHNENLY